MGGTRDSHRSTTVSETVMHSSSSSGARAAVNTAEVAEYLRSRTGGPEDDGPKILEHIAGWTLVVVLAMFVTQTGLL